MNVFLPAIDALVREGKSFALFRLPSGGGVRLWMQRDGGFLRNVEPQEKHFVFAPFSRSPENPSVALRAEICLEGERQICEYFHSKMTAAAGNSVRFSDDNDDANYQRAFDVFSEKLRCGELEKLVLSRKATLEFEAEISPSAIFFAAEKKYENAFVYLFFSPATGVWCGSTMEVLLSGADGRFLTMAVAGTQEFLAGKKVVWDSKNRREQAVVARFIRHALDERGIGYSESEAYTTQAANLLHLRTDFTFSSDTETSDLLRALHPTPAVCGIPKPAAERFILENEGYDRQYYSGYVGAVDSRNCAVFVNLRCAKIAENRAEIFAGGGLLPESEFDSEWNETQAKMQTMRDLF